MNAKPLIPLGMLLLSGSLITGGSAALAADGPFVASTEADRERVDVTV